MAKVGDAYIEIGAETDEAERDVLRFLTRIQSAGYTAGKYYSTGWDRALSRGMFRNTMNLFDQMGRTMFAPILGGLGRLRYELANANGEMTVLQRTMALVRGGAVAASIAMAALSTTIMALSVQAMNLSLMTSIIGSLLVVITSGLGAILSLGSGVSAAFQSLLAAPGILLGLGAAVGIAASALKDMGDRVGDLAPRFDALHNRISNNFWAKFEKPLRDLVDAALPALTKNIELVATRLGSFGAAMATTLGSAQSLEQMNSILENTGEFIRIASTGIQDFLEGFLTMGEAGATYLPRLAEWFNQVSENFNNWISAAVESGDFFRWVEEGIENLKALGGVIVSTMGIFGALGRAALDAGGSAGLGGLADGLARLNENLRTDEWQAAISGFFTVANAGTATVMDAFGRLFAQLGTMGDVFSVATASVTNAFGALIDGITAGLDNAVVNRNLITFFEEVERAVTTLSDGIEPLMVILSTGLASLGTLAAAVAPAVVALLDGLAGAFTNIAPLMATFAEQFGTALTQGVEAFLPVLQTLVTGVLPTMLSIFGELVPLLGPIGDLLSSILVPAMEFFADKAGLAAGLIAALVPHLSNWMRIIGDVANTLLTALLPPITKLTETLLPIFQDAISKIGPAFTSILEALKPVAEVIANILGPALEFLIPIISFVVSMIVDNLVGAIEGVSGVITGLVEAFKAAFSGDFATMWAKLGEVVMSALQAVWNIINLMLIGKVLGLIKAFVPTLLNLFRAGWSNLTGIVTSVWQTIQLRIMYAMDAVRAVIMTGLTAVRNFFMGIWNGFVGIVQAVWASIQSVISVYLNAVRAVVTNVLTAVGNFFRMIWTGFVGVVQTVWASISSVVSIYINAVRAVISTVLNAIRTVFTTIWNAIVSVVTTVWTALSNVVRIYINAVRAVIQNVLNVIRNVFTTVWNAIRTVVTTVVNAVRSVVTNVMNAIRSVITSVMNTVRNVFTSVWNAIRSVVTSVINAVRSVITSGMNTARSIVTTVLNTIRNGFTTAMNFIRNAVSNGISRVVGFFRDAPGKIKSALGNVGNMLKNAGRAIIDGFLGGLKATWGKVTDFVGGIASWIRDNKGPVSYDRKVLIPAGQAFMTGLLRGLDAGMDPLKKQMNDIVDEVVRGATDATTQGEKAFNRMASIVPNNMLDGLMETARPSFLNRVGTAGIDRTSLAPLGAAMTDGAFAARNKPAPAGDTYTFSDGAIQIPLEDLEGIKTLEDFIDMLRVRSRKGRGRDKERV